MPVRTPTTRTAVSTALVTTAVLASMLSLRVVVLPPWPGGGTTGVLLVGAAMIVTRTLIGGRHARLAAATPRGGTADDGGSSSVWPSLVGVAVAAWYLLARFGGQGGATDWLVTPSAVGRLIDQIGLAAEGVRGDIAPVEGSVPMALLCVGGALVVLVLADVVCTGLRRPVLGAACVLVLWGPPLVLVHAVPWPSFAVTVIALLLGLTLDEPTTRRRTGGTRNPHVTRHVRRAEGRRALWTTATAASITAIALVAASAAAGTQGVAGAWTALFTTSQGSGRLTDELDMYRSLTVRSDEVVLRYTTSTTENVGPLRLLTLTSFDGRRWEPDPAGADVEFTPETLLFPSPVGRVPEPTVVDVEIGSMSETRLPLAIEPRTVDTGAGWTYAPGRDEVIGTSRTREGDTFTMEVHPRTLTPSVLQAAPRGADEVDDTYLAVAQTAYSAQIGELARQITADAATDFDRAVALQDYLRDTRRFTYSTEVPRGTTGDAVWDFLEQRQGYCVQFATTMVVLARSVGIPARLAVGYLPGGSVADTGTWQITGEDSHAWPELYFPGSGWVRFEPTPASQTGPAPAYTSPQGSAVAPTPTEPALEPAPRPVPTTSADPTATATPTAAPATAPDDSRFPLGLLGGGVALLVLGGVVLFLLRRGVQRPPQDAEDAWTRVLDALESAGVTLSTATTPRGAPSEVAAAFRARTGTDLPRAVLDGLTELAGVLESERYAAPLHLEAAARSARLDHIARLTRGVTSGLAAATRTAR